MSPFSSLLVCIHFFSFVNVPYVGVLFHSNPCTSFRFPIKIPPPRCCMTSRHIWAWYPSKVTMVTLVFTSRCIFHSVTIKSHIYDNNQHINRLHISNRPLVDYHSSSRPVVDYPSSIRPPSIDCTYAVSLFSTTRRSKQLYNRLYLTSRS